MQYEGVSTVFEDVARPWTQVTGRPDQPKKSAGVEEQVGREHVSRNRDQEKQCCTGRLRNRRYVVTEVETRATV